MIVQPPNADERKMAMLAHVLQLFGGFVPPLVILIVKRDSRFVKFHSLQALIWQGTVAILMLLFFAGFMASMFLLVPMEAQPKHNQPPPAGFFVMFGGFWLLIMANWVVNLILAIYFGIKANEGAWSRYPLIGELAYRWSA
jgi:uncharacterized Tic20 family protein